MHRPPIWEPSHVDLTAYLLNDLSGARAEYVEAHLAICPECREQLARLQQTLGRLETMSDPDGTDLQQQSTLKARVQMEAASMESGSRGWQQRAQISLVTTAMLVLAIVLGPTLAGAGSAAIRDLINRDNELNSPTGPPRSDADDFSLDPADSTTSPARATLEVSELPYVPLAPATLPGSNQLATTTAFADGAFEGHYEGADGLELLLRQEPASMEGASLSENVEFEQIQISGVDTIIIYDERLGSVDQMFWTHGGMFFTLQAVRLGEGDFRVREALQIVEHLIALQDRGHVLTEPRRMGMPAQWDTGASR